MLDLESARKRVEKIAQGNIVIFTEEAERLALEIQAETLEHAKFMNAAQISNSVRDTRAEIAKLEKRQTSPC